MICMRSVFLLGTALFLAACGSDESSVSPPQDEAAVQPPADVDVLPPDESVATPTNDLAEGVIDTPPRDSAPAPNPAASIPSQMHGRWGLVAADCTSERGDAKGLIAVSADTIKFYESIARPSRVRTVSDRRIDADFAFSGEGSTWTTPMTWTVDGQKLNRVDEGGKVDLTYTRCPPGGQGTR